ncbi:hypothetical protein IFM89_020997 [Coptis chinensis]|uniref:Protein POLYCHOME n=1 Tax=Coptis chinensis TaxID=261450 RepID=A0A835H5X8_9MAGN|nr:hypothetical protein IFM89_020997 [Coptis chinensis]
MPESRERLVRSQDSLTVTPLRRRPVGGVWMDNEALQEMRGVHNSERRRSDMFGSPLAASAPSPTGRVGYLGTPYVYKNRSLSLGKENRAPYSMSRRRVSRNRITQSNSVLPSWYPRRPLQDITTVVRAIERRRARLREAGPDRLASPLQPELSAPAPDLPMAVLNPLEHSTCLATPTPRATTKRYIIPVYDETRALLDKQSEGESGFMTPQKKLLSSIEQVEKVVREEIKRMKRTPTAKRADREMKVRTLMSMR